MAELTDTQWYELLAVLPERPEAAEGWEMALVRRTADRLVREHVTAALDEIEKRINGWREMAEWAAAHNEDADQAQNSVIRERAYRRAVRIVRGYRQEQDR